MTVEERVLRLESAFVTLTRMAEQMDARLDRGDERASDFDAKLEALADAQIRTEDALARTNEALRALTVKVEALTDAQQHTDGRLSALIDIVQGGRSDSGQ
jgi:site-specific recombinase